MFSFTNTYQKKTGKNPRIVTYVEGPFYPDENSLLKDRKRELHEKVLLSMKENSKKNTVEMIKYVKKEDA